jgi:modulator of FtsH protease
VFLAGAFGFMFAIEKTKHSSTGVVLLLAFTFFMGLMLSRMLGVVLGFKNGAR